MEQNHENQTINFRGLGMKTDNIWHGFSLRRKPQLRIKKNALLSHLEAAEMINGVFKTVSLVNNNMEILSVGP